MATWTVEVDPDFAAALAGLSRHRTLEVAAICAAIRSGGLDAVGAARMDLEGVPRWDDLGSPISLRLPHPLNPRRAIQLEVWPDRRVVLCDVE